MGIEFILLLFTPAMLLISGLIILWFFRRCPAGRSSYVFDPNKQDIGDMVRGLITMRGHQKFGSFVENSMGQSVYIYRYGSILFKLEWNGWCDDYITVFVNGEKVYRKKDATPYDCFPGNGGKDCVYKYKRGDWETTLRSLYLKAGKTHKTISTD